MKRVCFLLLATLQISEFAGAFGLSGPLGVPEKSNADALVISIPGDPDNAATTATEKNDMSNTPSLGSNRKPSDATAAADNAKLNSISINGTSDTNPSGSTNSTTFNNGTSEPETRDCCGGGNVTNNQNVNVAINVGNGNGNGKNKTYPCLYCPLIPYFPQPITNCTAFLLQLQIDLTYINGTSNATLPCPGGTICIPNIYNTTTFQAYVFSNGYLTVNCNFLVFAYGYYYGYYAQNGTFIPANSTSTIPNVKTTGDPIVSIPGVPDTAVAQIHEVMRSIQSKNTIANGNNSALNNTSLGSNQITSNTIDSGDNKMAKRKNLDSGSLENDEEVTYFINH